MRGEVNSELFEKQNRAKRKSKSLFPIMRHVQAGIYMGEGKYDEAVQIESRLVNENPDFDAGRSALIFAYVAKKNYEEALNVAEGFRQLGWKELLKDAVYDLRGDQSSARTALKKYQTISQETYIDPAIVAYFYGNLGELDKTFAPYEQALEERSPLLLLFDMMSPSDRVKQDPRFKGLLKKIGLEK